MPTPWLASCSAAQGGCGPRPASLRAREGTWQTSWQPQERRSSGFVMVIKTPRSEQSRLSPPRHLRAGRPGSAARPGVPCGYPAPYRPAISRPTRRWGYGPGSSAQIGFAGACLLGVAPGGGTGMGPGVAEWPKGGRATFWVPFVLPAPAHSPLLPGQLPARRCWWIWFWNSA